MKTKIIDNWEVELTNDRCDTLTLKGEWYADFFKEYDGKQLIIADVVGRSEQLCRHDNIGAANAAKMYCKDCKKWVDNE
jgi:hypothetical protein